MFCYTFRKGAIKKLAIITLCAVVLTGSAIGVSALIGSTDREVAADMGKPAKISGIEDVSTMLSNYGIICDPATSEVLSVKIPRKWDDSFRAFNEVIRESGLDLSKSKGKKVDKWVVDAPALANGDQKTYAVVLVNKGVAIGAYLLTKPSGEVTGIKAPSASVSPAPLTASEKAANAGFGDASEVPADADAAQAAADADGEVAVDADAAQVVIDANAEAAMPTE